MEHIDPEIIHRLRRLAQEGQTVPDLLRHLSVRMNLSTLQPLLVAKYMREAFGLSLHDVKPIGGWSLQGGGELSDARLNEFIMPAIIANREWWERQMPQLSRD